MHTIGNAQLGARTVITFQPFVYRSWGAGSVPHWNFPQKSAQYNRTVDNIASTSVMRGWRNDRQEPLRTCFSSLKVFVKGLEQCY